MLGYDSSSYAGHLFRRGGASFAFQVGVPLELIKIMGDWKSNAVSLYLTVPLKTRLHTSNLITNIFSTPINNTPIWIWAHYINYIVLL